MKYHLSPHYAERERELRLAGLKENDIQLRQIAKERDSNILKTGFDAAKKESGNMMIVSDAARQAMISPRQVFRYLKAGRVATALGFIPLKKDDKGMISASRLQMIRILRDKYRRPGARYGAQVRRHRYSKTSKHKRRPQPPEETETWRVRRILALIDGLENWENLQLVRAYAVQKVHRYWR